MTVSDKTWAKVRAAYCGTDEPVRPICARFGVSEAAFYKRMEREDWPRRSRKPGFVTPMKRAGVASKLAKRQRASKATSKVARTALALRLYKALDLKLTQLEELMAQHNTNTSTMDHGRQTRAIAQLIKAFERVTEYDPELLKSASLAGLAPGVALAPHSTVDAAGSGPADASSSAAAADSAGTEQLRRDIASRIERIVAKRNAGEGAV